MVELEITTHSGEADIVKVDSFNADEMAIKINNHDMQVIAIGGNVYSRIDIKNIKPVVIEEPTV
ncbi:hypothetical protein GLW20_02280 [Virgibacillus halodenitrificans]|nr:hypothetical protein [Virgibacillus halodenitrificans]